MERYIKFAGLDFDLEKRLIEYISSHEKKINSLAEKCKKHGFSCLARRSDMMRLAVCIAYIKYTEEDYKQLGIDESILKEMPVYPAQGSLKMVNGVLLVKLGEVE